MGRAGQEIEIKLRVGNRAAFVRSLKRLGAKAVHGRMHEMNTLFDTDGGDLARRGQIIRLRVERPSRRTQCRAAVRSKASDQVTLTFKGPVSGSAQGTGRGKKPRYKVREEHEVRVTDAAHLEHILRAMGMRPWFRYEKYRSAFHLNGLANLVVEFDETPVGDFLELEGRPAEIDRAAALLGYTAADYITKSYGGLHLESLASGGRTLQSEPTPHSGVPDMFFHKRKR